MNTQYSPYVTVSTREVNYMKSKKWHLNSVESKAIVRNALLFLAPVAIVVLELFQRGKSVDEMLIAVKVWGIGVALDFFRKLVAGK